MLEQMHAVGGVRGPFSGLKWICTTAGVVPGCAAVPILGDSRARDQARA